MPFLKWKSKLMRLHLEWVTRVAPFLSYHESLANQELQSFSKYLDSSSIQFIQSAASSKQTEGQAQRTEVSAVTGTVIVPVPFWCDGVAAELIFEKQNSHRKEFGQSLYQNLNSSHITEAPPTESYNYEIHTRLHASSSILEKQTCSSDVPPPYIKFWLLHDMLVLRNAEESLSLWNSVIETKFWRGPFLIILLNEVILLTAF